MSVRFLALVLPLVCSLVGSNAFAGKVVSYAGHNQTTGKPCSILISKSSKGTVSVGVGNGKVTLLPAKKVNNTYIATNPNTGKVVYSVSIYSSNASGAQAMYWPVGQFQICQALN